MVDERLKFEPVVTERGEVCPQVKQTLQELGYMGVTSPGSMVVWVSVV